MSNSRATTDTAQTLVDRLLAARDADGVWVGELASSALSTATAVVALATASRTPSDRDLIARGLQWLVQHQNADGGWGDTVLNKSNISTTALCWAALAYAPPALHGASEATEQAEAWLRRAAGHTDPERLRNALAARYGKDRTFSAPILMTLAISGRLGSAGWTLVPQLPFELAACPQQWFQFLQLPVVSYALPALIAIGQARHHRQPSRSAVLRKVRARCAGPTLAVLRRIQPSTGGYLEATPLTSFVVMGLAAADQAHTDVALEGLSFLRASMRGDGSWPIDTNLATWLTTLAINALSASGALHQRLSCQERADLAHWIVRQQYRDVHPYTGAAPGGWAWTPLPGGVPDADDTAGALLALAHLGSESPEVVDAAAAGVEWLVNLQNRDGGIPTFCRGWGALPFDRSAPDLTAHALLAWEAWRYRLPSRVRARLPGATERALAYLRKVQHADGSWLPLWFGNEHAPGEGNPTYGTAKVVTALAQLGLRSEMLVRGHQSLLATQNSDGGWGGGAGAPSSVEETAFAVDALSRLAADPVTEQAMAGGAEWLCRHVDRGREIPPSPIGLYFAKLWYFERLYPLIFATTALGRVSTR
jgi:squalene-hopene/tetraprenyl-beta-curcumene cyclase